MLRPRLSARVWFEIVRPARLRPYGPHTTLTITTPTRGAAYADDDIDVTQLQVRHDYVSQCLRAVSVWIASQCVCVVDDQPESATSSCGDESSDAVHMRDAPESSIVETVRDHHIVTRSLPERQTRYGLLGDVYR